ncbi:hypothetical protein D9611_009925 [Ephemerocybe angulata]|uniref:Beta-glucuronidase C-terminal domain-containing protein n=1 Tax=Ephemerocybe angulata TaxID=980116 RepID=A0A8H5C4T8_9AGAR|nr:hypothetical protein D9611_009925 [Tulosesus angulatus]
MLVLALWSVFLTVVTQAVEAQVTVYGQIPLAQQSPTTTAGQAPAPTLPAYDATVLTPPPPPETPINQLRFEMPREAAQAQGLSIPHKGSSFFGFSIEMSVITQTIGKNSTHLFPPFLNLMSNIVERAGSVMIRLGGNTQEYAKFHEGLFDDGRITQKEDSGSKQTTETPAVLYTIDMFRMAANISSLLNVKWFLGLPFNDTSTFHLDMAEYGQTILGDNLLALQAGNEPDLYVAHQKRPEGWGVADYSSELNRMLGVVDSNDKMPVKNKFVAPSISQPDWNDIWNSGFVNTFKDRLFALTVERYPNNNCFMQFGAGTFVDPQALFPQFLSHKYSTDLLGNYLDVSRIAQEASLPFIMFETNTGSCGGFPGLSQSYGAALWILDYGLQMAYSNFTNALLHLGGQNVYYNPWISPPTNQTAFNQWTVGSSFYPPMIIAEVFGKSDTARIVDLRAASDFTPAYAIYERDVLTKFALFNFINDPAGNNNIDVSISIPNAGVPDSVKVKYFLADSVQAKTGLTWAGQTFGNNFEADGRLKGALNVTTVNCDRTANVCHIPLRAPSFALVFMDSNEATEVGQATATFATTAFTKGHNTIKADPSLVAMSNGHGGKERLKLGSTSHGSVEKNAASRGVEVVQSLCVLVSAMFGGWVVSRGFMR